jgi:hypothetical protein
LEEQVGWSVKWRAPNGIVPSVHCADPPKLREIFDQMDAAGRNPWIEDRRGQPVPRKDFDE